MIPVYTSVLRNCIGLLVSNNPLIPARTLHITARTHAHESDLCCVTGHWSVQSISYNIIMYFFISFFINLIKQENRKNLIYIIFYMSDQVHVYCIHTFIHLKVNYKKNILYDIHECISVHMYTLYYTHPSSIWRHHPNHLTIHTF